MFGDVPHIPHHAIRRPQSPIKSRHLLRAMGFTDQNTPEFHAFTAMLRLVAHKYLDVGRKLEDQDPMKLSEAYNQVCVKLPWVKVYKHLWPLKTYMDRHLKQTRASYRRRREQTRQTDSDSSDEAQSTDSESETESAPSHHSDKNIPASRPQTRSTHIIPESVCVPVPRPNSAPPALVAYQSAREAHSDSDDKDAPTAVHRPAVSTFVPKGMPVRSPRKNTRTVAQRLSEEAPLAPSSSDGFHEVVNILRPVGLEGLAKDFINAGAIDGEISHACEGVRSHEG